MRLLRLGVVSINGVLRHPVFFMQTNKEDTI